MKLSVTRIQRFSTHDGTGVRTVFFLKGCPLRCAWCHNPETQHLQPEVLYFANPCIGCGACAQVCPHGAHLLLETSHVFDRTKCAAQSMDLEEIVRAVLRDRAFYGETGGVTLSGGESVVYGLLTLELLRRCKAAGLTTAVETCGHFDPKLLPTLAQRRRTGSAPHSALYSRTRCESERCARPKHSRAVPQSFPCRSHRPSPYGSSKSAQLGRVHDGHIEWIPTEEEMARFRAVLDASF